jgi:hypothetical protein
MSSPLISPKFQFPAATVGSATAGYKVNCYSAGTVTPQLTYSDALLTTPNANPVIMDANGQADIWLLNLPYKFVGTDAVGTVLWTVDNVSQLGLGLRSEVALLSGELSNMVNATPVQLACVGGVTLDSLTEWSTNVFTAKIAGYYRVWGTVEFAEILTTTGIFGVSQGITLVSPFSTATFAYSWPFADSLGRTLQLPFNTCVSLSAGETIKLFVTANFTGTAPTAKIASCQIERCL